MRPTPPLPTRSYIASNFPIALRFLDSMSAGWNISLFHYRNRGRTTVVYWSACSGTMRPIFRRFLERLGYDYVEETGNPAYRMFLGR